MRNEQKPTTYWSIERLDNQRSASNYYYQKLYLRLSGVVRTTLADQYTPELCETLALTYAHYFEDVISEFGLWMTFTSKHKELYGKYLPFYDVNEKFYYQDEINASDVRFLTWMVFQKLEDNKLVDPYLPTILETADNVYSILDEEFEKAPINVDLASRMLDLKKYATYQSIREICIQLASKSYLLSPFTNEQIRMANEAVSHLYTDVNETLMSFAINSVVAFSEPTGPIPMMPKDWLASMMDKWGLVIPSKIMKGVEILPYALYQLTGYNQDYVFVNSIDGKEYKINRSSFMNITESSFINKGLQCALVKYNGQWYTNGVTSWMPDTTTFEKFKEESEATAKANKDLYKRILKANKKYPLLYFKDGKECLEWWQTNISIEDEQVNETELADKTFIAIFADEEEGISVVPGAAQYIKDKKNPYFNASLTGGLDVTVLSPAASDKMIYHCIEKKMLPGIGISSIAGEEKGKQLVQENLKFIAHFARGSEK